MEDNRLKIKVQDQALPAQRKQQRGGPPWLLVVGGVLVLVVIGAVLLRSSSDPAGEVPAGPGDAELAGVVDKQSAEVAAAPIDTTIADDGETMWVSPTAGEPLEVSYLPPGTQAVLHVRVAELLAHSESPKVLAALGPWGEQIVRRVESITGFKLSEIDTLFVGIRPSRSGSLEYGLQLRLKKASSADELRERQPGSRELKAGQQLCRVQKGWACFVPSQANGQMVVACSEAALPEVIEVGDEPLLFSRELKRVLDRTDTDRVATFVFAGKFLQISGKKFLQGTGDTLREALVDFLGDEATATAISLHWGDDFFLELQSTVALNHRPHRFAVELEKRVASASDQVEDTLLASPRHVYGRKVLARFPAMLRKLSNYTRAAEENRLTVMRAYLPITAGHNLALATELLLNTDGGDALVRGTGATAGETTSAGSSPQTLAERLQKPTSLVFPKETLQRALEILSEDLGISINIAGRDLQLEGITKNQSFGMELRNRPAKEILLAILLQANPDRTASGPVDVKQKLVYVVRPGQDGLAGEIVVTTRLAARRRGEKLPVVFEAP